MVKYLEMFDVWLEHPDNGFLVVCIILCIISVVCCIKTKREDKAHGK